MADEQARRSYFDEDTFDFAARYRKPARVVLPVAPAGKGQSYPSIDEGGWYDAERGVGVFPIRRNNKVDEMAAFGAAEQAFLRAAQAGQALAAATDLPDEELDEQRHAVRRLDQEAAQLAVAIIAERIYEATPDAPAGLLEEVEGDWLLEVMADLVFNQSATREIMETIVGTEALGQDEQQGDEPAGGAPLGQPSTTSPGRSSSGSRPRSGRSRTASKTGGSSSSAEAPPGARTGGETSNGGSSGDTAGSPASASRRQKVAAA